MKRRICTALLGLGLLLSGAILLEAGQRGRSKAQPVARVDVNVEIQNEVNLVFSSRDIQTLRQHYWARYRKLPKGLQKKLERTEHLPAGWQRDMEPFPIVIERKLVALPAGYRRGVIEGNAVIYSPRTQVIFDATILF